MAEIICVTNLNLFLENWPVSLPRVPVVGEEIESSTLHVTPTGHFRLSLEVAKVRWRCEHNKYYAEIELVPKKHLLWSLVDFYTWYAPRVGKDKSYFYLI